MMPDSALQREAEAAACKLSKRWLFERHYVIQDKSGVVRLMSPLKLAQRKLHAVLEWCRANDKPAWILVGKSRKEGISTYVAAYALDEYISRDIEVMVIAHEKRSSEYILGIYKRFYEYLDRQFDDAIAPIPKPPLHKGTTNKYEIRLEGYNGLIVIDTANNENAGRGRTPHIIHACIAKGSYIINESLGYPVISKVENIELGNVLRTHKNSKAVVSVASSKFAACKEIRLRTMQSLPITASIDHKFLTSRGWVRCIDLTTDDLIAFPVNKIANSITSLPFCLQAHPRQTGRIPIFKESIDVNYDLGVFLGLYLAEGSIIKNGSVPSGILFSIHRKETDKVLDITSKLRAFFKSASVYHKKSSLTTCISIYGKSLAEFVDRICGRVDKKHFPISWREMGVDFVRGLVHGYAFGDGSFSKDPNNRRFSLTSIRSSTILSMRDCLASLGYGWSGIRFKPAAMRSGRNEKDAWILELCGKGVIELAEELSCVSIKYRRTQRNKRNTYYRAALIKGGYAWLHINSIADAGLRVVYDFTVDHKDHSYCLLQAATHNSEAAFFEKGPVMAEALFQSMSRKAGTTFIMESTFNGEDALFWPMWQKAYDNSHLTFSEAKDGELMANFTVTNETNWNGWIPLFISVLDDEDAHEDFDSDDERDKFITTLDTYEQHLIDTMDAPLEYLKWRRMQIKQVCLGNIDKYKRGYPATVTEALVATKRSRFNYDALDKMPVEQPEKGELYHADTWDKKTLFRRDSNGLLYRYRDTRSGHRYVVGCDPAEGKLDDFGADPDASVIHVYDCDAGMEQAVAYYGQVSEENLVTPLHMICCYYNNAFCVIESNSTGKHVCIEMSKIYPSELLYHRDDWNPERSRASREVGHRTHVGNKNILIGGLAEAIETNQIIFHDAKTVRECKTYEYKEGGGTAARAGHHDDHPMAAALGVIGAKAFTALKRLNTQQTSYFKQWKESDTRETANVITGY